jgi:lipopolysaccharide transport system permease protein
MWEFRDLVVTLAIRDVRLRYRQTALGVLWVVLQPLMAAGIFSFVFGKIAGLARPGEAVPYFLLAFAGQIAWTAFASTLSKSSSSLVQNAALVSKVFFPRLILPLSTVFSSLIDFLVGLAMLLPLMLAFHVMPTVALLALPLWFIALLLMAIGVGMMTSALMVRYRDVIYIVPVFVQLLQFGSPAGWPLSEMPRQIPPSLQTVYYVLNPLAVLIEGFRWSLFGQGTLAWEWVAYSAGVSVFVFFVGAVVFRQQERGFADVI